MSPKRPSPIQSSEPVPKALKPKWFQILLALADQERHGLEIVREVERRTEGTVRLWPGALYGALEELSSRGWIGEVEPPPDAVRDGNPRYFRITDPGHRVLVAEVERLERLLQHARSKVASSRSR